MHSIVPPITRSQLLRDSMAAMGLSGGVRTASAARRLAECEMFALHSDEEFAAGSGFFRTEVCQLEWALHRPFRLAQRTTGLIELRVDFDGLAREIQSEILARIVLLRHGIFPRVCEGGRTAWTSYDADLVLPSAYVSFEIWRWNQVEFQRQDDAAESLQVEDRLT